MNKEPIAFYNSKQPLMEHKKPRPHLLSGNFCWSITRQRYTAGRFVSIHCWPSSTGEMAAAAVRYELDPDSPR